MPLTFVLSISYSSAIGPQLSEPLIIRTVQLTSIRVFWVQVNVLLEQLSTTLYISEWVSLIRTNSLIRTLLWWNWHKGAQIMEVLLYNLLLHLFLNDILSFLLTHTASFFFDKHQFLFLFTLGSLFGLVGVGFARVYCIGKNYCK